jgi:hypothetical protein
MHNEKTNKKPATDCSRYAGIKQLIAETFNNKKGGYMKIYWGKLINPFEGFINCARDIS